VVQPKFNVDNAEAAADDDDIISLLFV